MRIATVFALTPLLASIAAATCRCIPSQPCWPSTTDWAAFNTSVSGVLIKNHPIAQVCYAGPSYDKAMCDYVSANYMSAAFQLANPIGYQFPSETPCLPTANPSNSTCSIGNAPLYTVNATETEHLARAVSFAAEKNLRLVVRNTGHDLLARSTGFGSLQVWLHHYRKGISFAETYTSSKSCAQSTFVGPAFTIHGGYEWSDVYAEATKRGLLVVGGGTPTVGATGGWMQGGGHSPASNAYGLGADQVLEAEVLLADGRVVTADPCNEPLLYHAIRGGGPSAYGIVLSTTIKAYPTRNVTSNVLTITTATSDDKDQFLDALAEIYATSVQFLDDGFSGFGVWSLYGLGSVLPGGSDKPVYTHILSGFEKPLAEAQQLFSTFTDRVQQTAAGSTLQISSRFEQYATYAEAKAANPFTNSSQPAGLLVSYGSRLLDKAALTQDRSLLRATLRTIAGEPGENYMGSVLYVGGGQVIADANQPHRSALNSAWRRTYVHNIIARMWTPATPAEQVAKLHANMTNEKVPALKKLAPGMGAYMNEADANDPDYVDDFYGTANYEELLRIKRLYDPRDLFYCPTCVGSTEWRIADDGALCRNQSASQQAVSGV